MLHHRYLCHASIINSNIDVEGGESCEFTFKWVDGHEVTIKGEYCVSYDSDDSWSMAFVKEDQSILVDVVLHAFEPYVVGYLTLKGCCTLVADKYLSA